MRLSCLATKPLVFYLWFFYFFVNYYTTHPKHGSLTIGMVKIYDTCMGCTRCVRGLPHRCRCESACQTNILSVSVYLWHETTLSMGLAYWYDPEKFTWIRLITLCRLKPVLDELFRATRAGNGNGLCWLAVTEVFCIRTSSFCQKVSQGQLWWPDICMR